MIDHNDLRMVLILVMEHYFGVSLLMYANRLKDLAKSQKGFISTHTAGKVVIPVVWFSVFLLLVFSGVVYRVLASHLNLAFDAPIRLPMSLSTFPSHISNWTGTDLTIPNITKEYMEKNFADDFLSRRYVNSSNKTWADIYIVYCSSKPGGILGHRPRVCYTAHGWVHDSTEQSHFSSRAGLSIPCLIHRFHKPAPMNDQITVMNFYILNGHITTKESDFSSPSSRRPNLAQNPSQYVAQVQICSVLENSVRTAAKDITELVLDFFPDKNGEVRAADSKELITKD